MNKTLEFIKQLSPTESITYQSLPSDLAYIVCDLYKKGVIKISNELNTFEINSLLIRSSI